MSEPRPEGSVGIIMAKKLCRLVTALVPGERRFGGDVKRFELLYDGEPGLGNRRGQRFCHSRRVISTTSSSIW